MALSWNEITRRALAFSKKWKDESREKAEKDTFWNEFFEVFGISRTRVASFEESVKKLNNRQGFIDVFWEGKLLIEHKSRGGALTPLLSRLWIIFTAWKMRSCRNMFWYPTLNIFGSSILKPEQSVALPCRACTKI